jgi:NAD(P)-dependent dehydrogenase (short-subunit alcohol dehydrogenase family)
MTRVALVTGASRGLGRAIALRLGRDGLMVVVHFGTSREAAEQVVRDIIARGGQALCLQADMASVASIRSLYQQLDTELAARTGEAKFDVLVNNAGIALGKPIEQFTEADFDAQFAVNVKGVFFTTQMAIPRLRDNGRIVNIGTGLTRFSIPVYAAYAASKGAITVLAQHLAAELGARGITVNTLAPGAIDTDLTAGWLRTDQGRQHALAMSAIKRIGVPQDIADAASFLASEDSRWVTGQRIEASGGAYL